MIVISGVGCVLPSGDNVESFWKSAINGISGIKKIESDLFDSKKISLYGHIDSAITELCLKNIPRNLQRYSTRETSWAITAVNEALKDARIDEKLKEKKVGLFSSQGGYTHPSLTSYIDIIKDCASSKRSLSQQILHKVFDERALDPFLVIKSLTNGILGIVSLAMKLEGECGAFMQGVSGNYSAIKSAISSLNEKRIDIAIVFGSGSDLDPVSIRELYQNGWIAESDTKSIFPFSSNCTGGVAGEGGAAIILQRLEDCEGSSFISIKDISILPNVDKQFNDYQNADIAMVGATGISSIDKALCEKIRFFSPKYITSIQQLNGFLSAAPCFSHIIAAAQSLKQKSVPGINGLVGPIDDELNIISNSIIDETIQSALVLTTDYSGVTAKYHLETI